MISSKMNSASLLKLVCTGTLNKKDAKAAATILAKRFPNTVSDLLANRAKKVA